MLEVVSRIVDMERAEGATELPSSDVIKEVQTFLKIVCVLFYKAIIFAMILLTLLSAAHPNMIPQLIDRAQILNKHADAEWFRPTIEALTRVVNISKNTKMA